MAAPDQAAAAATVIAEYPREGGHNVKLPDFWSANPRIWFKQAEATFRRANCTDSFTKYDHVLMKLPQDVLDTVVDIINDVEETTVND